MTISFPDLLLLFGTLQGFILAMLLWTSRSGNRQANRLLGTLVGLLGLACLAVGIPVTNSWVSLMLDLLPLIVIMPAGPLIWLYTRSLLDPDFRLTRREKRHFWPVIIDCGSKLAGWGFIIGALLGVVDYSHREAVAWFMDEYNVYADIPRWLSVTTYVVLTYRWLQQYARHYPQQQLTDVRWLRQFMLAFLAFQSLWLMHLIPYINPATRNALLDAWGWYPLYIPIAVLIYWLGLRGYLHARSQPTDTQPATATPKPAAKPLSEAQANEVAGCLYQAMETGQLFLDPELTLDKVSRHVQVPAKTISAVLNQHLGKSFNQFVNEYRIDAFKQKLTDPAHSHLTLTGLAFECGFNSQATFQRTFKQLTGATPGAYLQQQTA